ncbi:MAG TPA: hypothetical protein PLV52_05505, partial [Candidatus Omnitrophota bacterium]|nr:hypothetical protein [Candidatus Omnitrophota bacterium]
IMKRSGVSESVITVRKRSNPVIKQAIDDVTSSDGKILAAIEALQKDGVPHITFGLIAERAGVSQVTIKKRKDQNQKVRQAIDSFVSSEGPVAAPDRKILDAVEELKKEGADDITQGLIAERSGVSQATISRRKKENPIVKQAVDSVASTDAKILSAIEALVKEGARDITQRLIADRAGVAMETVSYRKRLNPVIRQALDRLSSSDPEVGLPQDGKLRLRQRTSKDGSVSLAIDPLKPPVSEMRKRLLSASDLLNHESGVFSNGSLPGTQYAMRDTQYENTAQPGISNQVRDGEDSVVLPVGIGDEWKVGRKNYTLVFKAETTLGEIEEYIEGLRYAISLVGPDPAENKKRYHNIRLAAAKLKAGLESLLAGRRLGHEPCINCVTGGGCRVVNELILGGNAEATPDDNCGAINRPSILNDDVDLAIIALDTFLAETANRNSFDIAPRSSQASSDESAASVPSDKQYEKEASTFVHSLKRRAYKIKDEAKKESDAIIVAVETNGYIPTEQRGMIQPLLRELTEERLGASFAKIGLDNVKFVQGTGEAFVNAVLTEKGKTGAKARNVIVLGTKGVVDMLSGLEELKGETEEEGAFFAEMDTTEMTGFQYIRLLQMLTIALKAAYGEGVSQSSYPMI